MYFFISTQLEKMFKLWIYKILTLEKYIFKNCVYDKKYCIIKMHNRPNVYEFFLAF